MNIIKSLIATTLSLAILGGSTLAFAEQAPKPEKLIQWRQSAYRVLEWNVARIKSSFDGQYNKADVVTSANTIAAIANANFSGLFAAGTETGKGWHATSANEKLFKEKARFTELSNNLSKEAAELVKVANSSNDAAGIKEQFGKLTKTCKACHDDYKGDD